MLIPHCNSIYYLFIIALSFQSFSQNQSNDFFKTASEKQAQFSAQFSSVDQNNSTTFLALQKKHQKFSRWQWFWQNRVDANGNLTTYPKTLYAPKNLYHLTHNDLNNNTNDNAPDWKIVGPQRYPDGTNPFGIKGIGRIDAIVTNPLNENHVIIGARAGGIWETFDISKANPEWFCLSNDLPVFTVNDLKIVNGTLYACTSNKNQILRQGDDRYGLGVIKKKLFSNHWELPNISFESKKLAVSKSNSKLMYAVGEKYIFKTENAGDTWQKLNDVMPEVHTSKLFLTNVEINPKNNNIIIVTGKLYVYDLTNNKKTDILIFKSKDGGMSWENLTPSLENFINKKIKTLAVKDKPICFSKGGSKNQISTYLFNDKLYLCIQEIFHPNRVFFVTMHRKWNNFELYNSVSKGNRIAYHTDNMEARFQIIDDSKIIIGNRKLRVIDNDQHQIIGLDNNYKFLHQDIRAIHYNSKLKRLLLGTDGGINIGRHNDDVLKFTSFSNACGNLNLFLAFNMSYFNGKESRTIRIGNQDTGYYRTDFKNDEWSNWERFGPFGEGQIYTDPENKNILYRVSAGGIGGNVLKSSNEGKTFAKTPIKMGNYVSAPLGIDPTNTNHLLFDNHHNYDQYILSLSNNQLDSFVNIDNGIPQLKNGVNLAVAISKKNPKVFYVARKDVHLEKYGINNALFKSENLDFNSPENITYTELTHNFSSSDDPINKAFITDIALNDEDENQLWICFGNLEQGKKVYFSEDGGLHWKNISKNLPNVPVNTIKFDQKNKELYVGNDYGVYQLNKTTGEWNRFGKNLPVCIVTTIAIDHISNEIIAATHGRSVWIASIEKF